MSAPAVVDTCAGTVQALRAELERIGAGGGRHDYNDGDDDDDNGNGSNDDGGGRTDTEEGKGCDGDGDGDDIPSHNTGYSGIYYHTAYTRMKNNT